MPPIIEDMSLDIMEENEEEELLENDEEFIEDMLEDMPPIPMSMPPIFDIILLIMSSMPRDFMSRSALKNVKVERGHHTLRP